MQDICNKQGPETQRDPQELLAIQNLKLLFFSSPPHQYQPSKLNLPGNLQQVQSYLQDIQPL